MIKSLTSLRGLFILFIFFHHCLDLYPGGGSMAVAFFFILGGFGLTLGYHERVTSPEFSYKQYLTKRVIRFYPLHWLCLLAALPLFMLSFRLGDVPILALNAALLQTWVPIKEVYFSFNAVSWYLADTMFFAIVFPFFVKWIVKASPKGKSWIAMVFIVVYALVAILIPAEKYHAILYISPYMRLADFVLGIYLALGYMKWKEKPINLLGHSVLTQVLILAIIVLLVIESCVLTDSARLFAVTYWPLVALLIIITALSEVSRGGGGQDFLHNKYLQRLGELSFTIFLVHQLIIRYAKLVFGKILHFENDIIFVILTLTLTLILSIAVEKYILKPITQWLSKRNQPSMTARS